MIEVDIRVSVVMWGCHALAYQSMEIAYGNQCDGVYIGERVAVLFAILRSNFLTGFASN